MGNKCFAQTVFLGWLLLINMMVLNENRVEAASRMEELCNLTGDDFLLCMDCLKGPDTNLDRSINGEDDYLGGKTIKCAHRSAIFVQNMMKQFSTNSTGLIKEAADICIDKLAVTVRSYDVAMQYWSYHKKEQTVDAIAVGLDYYLKCAYEVVERHLSELNPTMYCLRARGTTAEQIIRSINV